MEAQFKLERSLSLENKYLNEMVLVVLFFAKWDLRLFYQLVNVIKFIRIDKSEITLSTKCMFQFIYLLLSIGILAASIVMYYYRANSGCYPTFRFKQLPYLCNVKSLFLF